MTPSNEFEIKPCPFCGGTGKLFTTIPFRMVDIGRKFVACEGCEARGSKFLFNSNLKDKEHEKEKEILAVNAWNNRHP